MTMTRKWRVDTTVEVLGERRGPVKVDGAEMVSQRHLIVLTCPDADKYAGSSDFQHQQGYLPSRASTPTFTEGSREGHRPRDPYVSNLPLVRADRVARLDCRGQYSALQGGD